MPVLPEQITTQGMRRRWRGYDRGQVEQLLARVAADYAGAIERIAHEATQPPETLVQARREATAEADAIRGRAEAAAQAITRQAEALRAQAQADADTARDRLEQADGRARRIEQDARERWDGLRAETEHRWERLLAADRQLDSRIQQVEQTLARLRAKIVLLDQVSAIEDDLAAIRALARPATSPLHNGTSPASVRPAASSGNQ